MKQNQIISDYYDSIKKGIDETIATLSYGEEMTRDEGIHHAVEWVVECRDDGGKVYFIGNGASAAIASHQSTDFWKAGRVPSQCFNDPALLTCMGNDYGYDHVFEKPVEMFVKPGDILMAISSSGNSRNIHLAVEAAHKKGVKVITFSGFDPSNKLRTMGDLNFYVPNKEYGPVEVIHHSISHCILDTLIELKKDINWTKRIR